MVEAEAVEMVNLGSSDDRSRLETVVKLARLQPRRIEVFRAHVLELCTLNEDVAEQCLYALPRTKKGDPVKIEGPSIRMAEIVLKSWKNAGVFASLVPDGVPHKHVVAQATFVDFEDLTMVSKTSKRRVFGAHADAQVLAENAAIAIATRNVILAGIPRAFWQEAYEKARAVAAGTLETLETRRSDAVKWLVERGVTEARIFAAIDVTGIHDVGLEQLALLRTLARQVRAGDMTAEQAFPDPAKADEKPITQKRGTDAVKEHLGIPEQ